MTGVAPWFRRAGTLIAIVVAMLATLGPGRLASAHTDFDSSSPADGTVVDAPLTDIVVDFTNPARPAGAGFELIDAAGVVRAPTAIDETDGTSFVLSFDPPITAGTYGLRWSVRAGDAHPIEGSFRFEVVAGTAAVPTSDSTDSATGNGSMAGHDMDGMHTGAMDMDATDHGAMDMEAMHEFLNSGIADDAAAIGRAGRALSMLGTIFGIGLLAALVWTVRGSRAELVAQVGWVRLAGLAVAAGGLVELAALAEVDPTVSIRTLVSSWAGLATALKMAGGVALLVGFHAGAGRIVAPARPLSAAVLTDVAPPRQVGSTDVSSTHDADGDAEHRWVPTPRAALGIAGVALVLISFWFDGHTVSRGWWPLHSMVNLVHLAAAATWAGGVFAMTAVAWMRRRRAARVELAAMVVRFSSMATVSLLAVLVAGTSMTWLVVDTPGDIVDTEWGRYLIAKTAVVAVAAGLGGYNHFRLRPALEQRPDDPELARRLRRSLTTESALFVAVVALSAVLVAAAT